MRKHQKTDRLILHAAKVLFEQEGISNVTFSEIADEAGICRTTVFNHFKTTEQLTGALALAEIDELLTYAAETQKSGIELIMALFDRLIDDTANYPRVMTRLTNQFFLSPDGARMQQIEALISEHLLLDAARMTWPTQTDFDADRMAQIILGTYYGQVNHRLIGNLPFCRAEMKKEFQEILYYIIGYKGEEENGSFFN